MNAQIEYHTDFAYLVIDGESYEIPLRTAHSIAEQGITINKAYVVSYYGDYPSFKEIANA